MLPPTSLPIRPRPRDWIITGCVVLLASILLWWGLSFLRPPHFAPEFQAGLNALDANRVEEACPLFDHALAADPANPDLYATICETSLQKKQWLVMADYARRGVKACPNAPVATRLMFHRDLALGLMEAKPAHWQEEALQAAKQAYELDPQKPELQNLYGYALTDIRDDAPSLEQAENLLTGALHTLSKADDTPETRAQRAITQDSYGWVCYKRGEFAEAVDALNEAIENMPAEAQDHETMKILYYHLGAAYHKMGRPDAARLALERALNEDPNYPEAKAELAALNLYAK